MLVNIKNDSLVAVLSKLLKSCLGMFEGFWLPLYKLSIQISMISCSRIFVNKKSTSRLAMCQSGLCWQIPSAKWNESIMVYSLAVEGVKKWSKNFANLWLGVPTAETIGRKVASFMKFKLGRNRITLGWNGGKLVVHCKCYEISSLNWRVYKNSYPCDLVENALKNF